MKFQLHTMQFYPAGAFSMRVLQLADDFLLPNCSAILFKHSLLHPRILTFLSVAGASGSNFFFRVARL